MHVEIKVSELRRKLRSLYIVSLLSGMRSMGGCIDPWLAIMSIICLSYQ